MGLILGRLNASGPAEYGSKLWLERQLVVAIDMCLKGRPASNAPKNPQPSVARNPSVAINGIMALARLKGFIVEKKQSLRGTIDLAKLPASEAKATLEQMLDGLKPGERQKVIEIMANAADVAEVE